MRHLKCFLGAEAPGWAAPAHPTSQLGVWDHIKAAAKGTVAISSDTLKNVSPILTSYFNAETARANARAASSNLLPRSITDKNPLTTIGGPVALGVGVLAVVMLAGSLGSRRRR